MKQLMNGVFLVIIGFVMCHCNVFLKNDESKTGAYFESFQKNNDVAKLTMFMSQMPKGGDIHHHYSGALFAETYLDWAQETDTLYLDTHTFYLVDTHTLKLNETPCNGCISIDSLKRNDKLFRRVVATWSDLDYGDHYHSQVPPDQHFFSTFGYFGSISGAFYPKGLRILKERAKKENIQYLESMLNSPGFSMVYEKDYNLSIQQSKQGEDTSKLYALFDGMSDEIVQAEAYDPAVQAYIDSLHSYHQGIDDSSFIMRFQTYVSRNSNPAKVFARLHFCFDATARDRSRLLVGVNIVGPENGRTSMNDYWLHMQMFRYLKAKFPHVQTSMHAGELRMGMVKPENLKYHVHDAIFIANANRIGHGVDIPYESASVKTLQWMMEHEIPVEINLTSNEFILGIEGNKHPVNIYHDAGVPLVISTDDAGVSRNSLTTEYKKLASRYDFSYSEIKAFVYNSINYSFMTDEEKEIQLKLLNQKFDAFETTVANL
ncbi:adenosine deaminase [Marinilabiliaceae bacterium JC017]|nr:adenosine deaminase [Marinilabiliaceae bacterium JC017]